MEQIIECVPNFSEGRNKSAIDAIANAIINTPLVKLLHIDIGFDANRTVFTFAGTPQAVIDAAYNAITVACKVIDMKKHQGTHPRIGATDVCPLVPVKNITLEETAVWAQLLARRVGNDLKIPVYLYEAAQPREYRKNLAAIRSGGYEGLFEKMKIPEWEPDYGNKTMNAENGATVIGARNFLIAYNINLNTCSAAVANSIARKVRESGYVNSPNEPGGNQQPVRVPGTLKTVKAIGWYIPEYKKAQVSLNVTDINTTPVHIAFNEVKRVAVSLGAEVTGSELIGLIPLQCLLEAGIYALRQQQNASDATTTSETVLIKTAVDYLGLNELEPFDANNRVIEYLLK